MLLISLSLVVHPSAMAPSQQQLARPVASLPLVSWSSRLPIQLGLSPSQSLYNDLVANLMHACRRRRLDRPVVIFISPGSALTTYIYASRLIASTNS